MCCLGSNTKLSVFLGVQVWSADSCSRHAAAVKCLEFNQMPDGSIKLASSGADHALRIFNIEL